ncbi:MAG TPA: 1-deoxy-D-xylulose-5-phosphate reductoisomerase [Candidatus Acidoferrales bacterium]|nr:1-deoxy-D-xylulose-5-phosphate reductoisomerase [Candidatus Acidoferrales bacterium]
MRRKRVAILGSTGSIGTQALDVVARHPHRFEIVGLAAGRNVALLREQCARFSPRYATSAQDGPEGLLRVAVESEPDIVLAATDGAVAFDAVFAAVERGIDVAVANKELVVAAGELLVDAARRSGAQVLPVDSEHSAIFQSLVGEDLATVACIVLTASGGPFWRWSREEIERADVKSALAHPTWQMGTKNTIDSASMMNKGLEVIEASRLFGLPPERIAIVVHPQSIAHGFVVFFDGNVKGQIAAPDMRLPIGYALAYPDRLPSVGDPNELNRRSASGSAPPAGQAGGAHAGQAGGSIPGALRALGGKDDAAQLRYEFEAPDLERFPCVRLAYQALQAGGTAPAVLSAANEVAVEAFVEGRIAFGEIPRIIEAAMARTTSEELSLDAVRRADRQAREVAQQIVLESERSSC